MPNPQVGYEPDLVKRLGLIAVNWESVAPGTMREAVIDAKGEVEKLSALWIAETRENEKLRADLASTRSVYDFAALEAKITELRAALETVKLYAADQIIWNAVVVPIGESPHDKLRTLGQTVERALDI